MGSKMLIDAAHPEETRVVVVRGNNRIEELDYEASARKRLRGNIYLAKVTRVEPSLQAAFVDYGGNRHGFLAFNEIHPDYYQIPVADREALLQEEAEEEAAEEREAEEEKPSRSRRRRKKAAPEPEEAAEAADADASQDEDDEDGDRESDSEGERTVSVESVGSEDALEEVPRRAAHRKRTYKIQEVIKRRQVILVQVVKEERGNKGAALTTYLSLAGRYCVLMPNTARGGGISRKITDAPDRKRLKDVAKSIEVPAGMGLIVRTAGASRTKAEIKRDYDYLIRLWENVRDLTLKSNAPSLVYEEGSLIKRAIRDLYTKEMDEILVEGEEGYKEAKDFMRMLMPSHARHVKSYKDNHPLFMKYRIENQLDVLFSPQVQLSSGGYIVINQTEALVAIDVNSGKATREHNIEDTALRTNMEAAEEVSRQMRLRDLAGLIVIDFIDMEERRNNRSVERRLKEKLKSDRARIQVGRISHFGLLEMSRQRMRSGVLESSTRICPTCDGRGFVRSVPSAALNVLRGIEEHLQRHAKEDLAVQAPLEVVLYILNQKRDHLLSLEASYGITVYVEANERLSDAEFAVERALDRGYERKAEAKTVQIDSPFMPEDEEEDEKAAASSSDETEDDEGPRRKRRRRRRGRRGSRQRTEDGAIAAEAAEDEREAAEARPKRSRRGSRRRGRGSNGASKSEEAEDEAETKVAAKDDEPQEGDGDEDAADDTAGDEAQAAEEAPTGNGRRRGRRSSGGRGRKRKDEEGGGEAGAEEQAAEAAEPVEVGSDEPASGNGANIAASSGDDAVEAEPETSAPETVEAEAKEEPVEVESEEEDEEEPAAASASSEPPRRGWWQRRV